MGLGVAINTDLFKQLFKQYSGTKDEFLKAAKISDKSLQRYLKGKNPNPSTLQRIASALGVEINALLPGAPRGVLAANLLERLANDLGCCANEVSVSGHLTKPDNWEELEPKARQRAYEEAAGLLTQAIDHCNGELANMEVSPEARKEAHELAQTLMAALLAKVMPIRLRSEEILVSLLIRCPELTKPMIAAVMQQVQGGVVEYQLAEADGNNSDDQIKLANIYRLQHVPEGEKYSIDEMLWNLHTELFPDSQAIPHGRYPEERLKELCGHLVNKTVLKRLHKDMSIVMFRMVLIQRIY